MASSSSNPPHVTLEVGEEYPYPSHVCAPNFVTFKLSGRYEYGVWKTQMECLLESHGMLGFIDGTFVSPHKNISVSGKEKVISDYRLWLWRRSDALVRGWILGSLSKQTLTYVLNRLTKILHEGFSAKDLWDELHTIYHAPPAAAHHVLPQGVADKEERGRAKVHQVLYEAALDENWHLVKDILETGQVTTTDKITNTGNTALHVAVGTSKKPEFLQKMLEMTPESTQLLDLTNSDGSTLLHVAAIVGNTEAAKILVARNPDLLFGKDKDGKTPLAIALTNMYTEIIEYLLEHIKTDTDTQNTLFSGTSGEELLVTIIFSEDFLLASSLATRFKTFHSDAVLMAIAQSFPCELNMLENYIGKGILHVMAEDAFKSAFDCLVGKCVSLCGSWVEIKLRLFCRGIQRTLMLFPRILKMLVWPFIKTRVDIHNDASDLLGCVCRQINEYKDSDTYHHYYTNPILEATRQNAHEVVRGIVHYFPNAIWSANKDGHNIIQYAVINRSEKVYNLLYQMSEQKNVYRAIKDSYGNNLLHLVARLAPANKLNLISGAALQIQRELQWFKEVEGFVPPLNTIQKNSFNETPEMVFTREHKELVIEGEKWLKTTAESYTITAALITTIVFAAAITVPGGNKDTGIPNFISNIAFKVFAISVAISLFTSVTSLLMFLSILTARFAQQDFLLKLPTKLIIGLTTLFISTTAMLIAFGATLYLVFGQNNSRILIPIAVLTCLPITSFVTLQFPLVLDLMSATYGRSIFGKKKDDHFY